MLLINSCQRTLGLLPRFHFKTGTVLGKLGQAGLIRAPHCSLRVGLAELLLSCKVPVVRGWAEAWKISMSVLLQCPKGVCSIEVSWTLLPACLLSSMAPIHTVLTLGPVLADFCALPCGVLQPVYRWGNWGPEKLNVWFRGTQPCSSKARTWPGLLPTCASVLQTFQGARKNVHLQAVKRMYWLQKGDNCKIKVGKCLNIYSFMSASFIVKFSVHQNLIPLENRLLAGFFSCRTNS